jgi:hypothetical protein
VVRCAGPYSKFLTKKLKSKDSRVKADATIVHDALLVACGEYLKWQQQNATVAGTKAPALPPGDSTKRYAALRELFGEKLTQYLP